MFKINFKEKINGIFGNYNKGSLKSNRNSNRDWVIVLVIFSILLVVLSIINWKFFVNINKEEIFYSEDIETEDVTVFYVEKLDSVIDKFDEKVKNFDNIRTKKPNIIDPSR